jgi:hypothetical protein
MKAICIFGTHIFYSPIGYHMQEGGNSPPKFDIPTQILKKLNFGGQHSPQIRFVLKGELLYKTIILLFLI